MRLVRTNDSTLERSAKPADSGTIVSQKYRFGTLRERFIEIDEAARQCEDDDDEHQAVEDRP